MCRSGAVGSKPALIRSGRPSFEAGLQLLALEDLVGAAADQVEGILGVRVTFWGDKVGLAGGMNAKCDHHHGGVKLK